MPETGYSQNKREFTSMIRVHDLSDGFRLVGQYDFPEDGRTKRLLKINGGNVIYCRQNIFIYVEIFLVLFQNIFNFIQK